MNCVFLIGRLCDDPKPFYDQSKGGELNRVVYTLAVPRSGGRSGSDTVDFIPVVVFEGAKFALNYFKKGMRVAVSGPIHQSILSNKDGSKFYKYDVVAKNQEFADTKQKAAPAAAEENPKNGNGFMDIPDSDDGQMFS